MLSLRLCVLGTQRGMRPAIPRGALTLRLTRSYATHDGTAEVGAVWDREADAQLAATLNGPSTSEGNMGSGRKKPRWTAESGRRRPRAEREAEGKPPHRRTEYDEYEATADAEADTRGTGAEGPARNRGRARKRRGYGLLKFGEEPQQAEASSHAESNLGSVDARVKKATTIAAQRDHFLKINRKATAQLEKSPKEKDQETARGYTKSLASMNERLDRVMDSLKNDMTGEEYEGLVETLRSKGTRDGRSVGRPDKSNPEGSANSQSTPRNVALGKNATLRKVNWEAARLDAARKWAVMARRQAARAAQLAEKEPTRESKSAAKLLASTATLAAKEFQQLREYYGDRLNPADLRDIEVGAPEAMPSADHLHFRKDGRFESEIKGDLSAADFPVKPIKPPREGQVARLANNLQRVLFSPGVHYVRDPRTGVWNFPHELTKIPTPEEFNFDTLPDYITASKDPELAELAQRDGVKYTGSTSTLTGAFGQVWLTLNGGQGVDISKLTQDYANKGTDYTVGAQLPAAIAVWPQPNGRYAVDSDKRFQTDENILSEYGNILEKILTTDASEWWKSLKKLPEGFTPPEKPTAREAYAYSRGGKILMRSQLDCQDNRLPGSGTFDIKTRAAMPIRHDRANWEAHQVYDISETLGQYATFERETFDLTRSGMLKYCFQARIGDMDGIFIAYHNTARCFGFEYMPRTELDTRLFGSPDVGDQVFQLCIGFFERIMDLATSMFPGQALSVVWFQRQPPASGYQKARMGSRASNELIVAVQPFEYTGEGPVPTRAIRIQMINNIDGRDVPPSAGVRFFHNNPEERVKQKWTVRYDIAITPDTLVGHQDARAVRGEAVQRLTAMNLIAVPEGKMPHDMYPGKAAPPSADAEGWVSDDVPASEISVAEAPASETSATTDASANSGYDSLSFATIKWVEPSARIRQLRKASYKTGKAYDARTATWNADVQQMRATDPEPESKPEPYVIPEHTFTPTKWRERAPAVDSEFEKFAEAAAAKAQGEDDVAVDLDAAEEAHAESAKHGQNGEQGKPKPAQAGQQQEGEADKCVRDLPPHFVSSTRP